MRHVNLKHGIAAVSAKIKPETLNALDEMMAAAGKQMQIKESPILFSSPMIIAILTCAKCGYISEAFPCAKCGSEDFVKSQTRRVVKFPKGFKDFRGWTVEGQEDMVRSDGSVYQKIHCPYGNAVIVFGCAKLGLRGQPGMMLSRRKSRKGMQPTTERPKM